MMATVYTAYGVMNFVHAVSAVVWIGGGATLGLLALRAIRARDPFDLATIARQVGWLGNRVFAPASVVLLASGIGMMVDGSLPWGKGWIILSLVVWVAGFLLGILFFGPEGARIGAQAAAAGVEHPDVQRRLRRVFLVARLDTLLLLLVVVAMAIEPSGADLAATIAVGAGLALAVLVLGRADLVLADASAAIERAAPVEDAA